MPWVLGYSHAGCEAIPSHSYLVIAVGNGKARRIDSYKDDALDLEQGVAGDDVADLGAHGE